jgi:hypothetical protein
MSSTCYNLTEDWGWYVDIENMNPIYQTRKEFATIPHRKFKTHYNKLEPIEEDEYEYYLDKQKNLDDLLINKNDENIDDNNKENKISNNLIKFTSTTMISALITYIVFYIL